MIEAAGMRAAFLDSPSASDTPLIFREAADPKPEAGEVLLEVRACAVCRTDLQICRGELPVHRSPVIPGHQIVGQVIEVGPGVLAPKLGERVGVGWLASTDGSCRQCRRGRENLCEAARFTGWDVDGGYATRAVARADFTYPLPDGFDDLQAAPLLCGGVIGYRSLLRSGIQPGGRLGLYGFGASAHLTIQVARFWGCRVFVVTRSPEERRRALALGAEWSGDSLEKPPEPLDAAVTFAPVGSLVRTALQALAPGGTVAINAIHLDGIPAFPYDELWRERGIVSVANFTREDARAFLELAGRIPIAVTLEAHPLEEANRALLRLERGEVAGAAVLRV
jgi:propanol-preferring alcohol dehydrogenase